MKHLGALLFLVAVVVASTSARAETSPVETGSDSGADVALDTSLPDVLDDADDAEETSDAPTEDVADTAIEDTLVDDTGADAADTADTADTAVAIDSTPADTTADAADTARPPGPGTVTENPDDPFATTGSSDACNCQAPGGDAGLGGFVALMGALLALTRRQSRR